VPALDRFHERDAARPERQALQAQAARPVLGGTRAAHLKRGRLDRRAFLRLGRDLALLALLPGEARAAAGLRAREGAGLFLSATQLETLRALCARFIPGPPDDPDPGAREAGVAESIDLMLGMFERTPIPLFAGGPFSHREGGGPNAFADFLALDAIDERVWRTRIEGSRGLAEREWSGPVIGLQERYTRGLERLERRSREFFRRGFHELAAWQAELLLRTATGELREFLDLAFAHSVEGMYGPPEYGGNRGRVGWGYTRWPGDHQPHAYRAEEISLPDADQREAVARAGANAASRRRTP
jgi:hypothetical protein